MRAELINDTATVEDTQGRTRVMIVRDGGKWTKEEIRGIVVAVNAQVRGGMQERTARFSSRKTRDSVRESEEASKGIPISGGSNGWSLRVQNSGGVAVLNFIKDEVIGFSYNLSEGGEFAKNSVGDDVPLQTAMDRAGIGQAAGLVLRQAKAAISSKSPAQESRKADLPAGLYRVALHNLKEIEELEESVSDETGAVESVKRLGLKLAEAMKSRDRAKSLAIVEKIDLQIRGYMDLRETTTSCNYLVMENFQRFQKRSHQLFDEVSKEWLEYLNQ
jgi:hypothetical protein